MPKSRWDEVKEKLTLVEAWARDGLIEEQIAKNLGIGVSTLSKYKVEHVELVEALKSGKEVVDYQVENSLLKRAMGYSYTEKEYRDGELVKETVKEVAPDTTAQIFWLKNRKPKEWRDKQDVDITGDIKINITLDE